MKIKNSDFFLISMITELRTNTIKALVLTQRKNIFPTRKHFYSHDQVMSITIFLSLLSLLDVDIKLKY